MIEKADLVIHHGGNNTFNDTTYYGKPSIILPYAIDQYNVAKRAEELGIGIHLNRYNFTKVELIEAINSLLNNDSVKKSLCHISQTMQKKPGVKTGAQYILNLLN
jgi:UDP:flavonoid glycosyltransferase YjiC (YdhE family)